MIYCVEDDDEIRNLITYTLKAAGYEALGLSNGASLWEILKDNKPDLIMLDIMLPDEDGISILKKLKNNDDTKKIPVMMETAKGTEYDKVVGLDLGADDYLTKPFGMMEMIARVKAVLRRANRKNGEEILTNGAITVDTRKHIASVDNELLTLTLKEYDLLALFLNNIDQVFTRDQLLEHVWGMYYVGESRTIDVHVGTLRTKLGRMGYLIETVRGVGYRMVKA